MRSPASARHGSPGALLRYTEAMRENDATPHPITLTFVPGNCDTEGLARVFTAIVRRAPSPEEIEKAERDGP